MPPTGEVITLFDNSSLVQRPKYQVFNIMLGQGTVKVFLDPNFTGVNVPDYLKLENFIVLEIGYDMPVPINDLNVNPWGFEATLSFNHVPVHIQIPFDSVFALTDLDNLGVSWQRLGSPAGQPATLATPGPTKPNLAEKRKRFTVLDGGKK